MTGTAASATGQQSLSVLSQVWLVSVFQFLGGRPNFVITKGNWQASLALGAKMLQVCAGGHHVAEAMSLTRNMPCSNSGDIRVASQQQGFLYR